MANPTNFISQVQLDKLYDIYALGLNNNGTFYNTQELLDMITGAGFQPKVTTTLPTPTAAVYEEYKNTITFVEETSADGKDNAYDEYVIVKGGTASTPTYAWEVIGHTGVQLSGLKTVASVTEAPNTNATGSAGAHTINGSNFSFSGTAGDVSVSGNAAQGSTAATGGDHTHSITSNLVYAITDTALSGGAVSTSAETFAKAGTALDVVTGGSKENVIGSVTSSKLATTSIIPAGDATNVAGPRSSWTAVVDVTTETTSITPVGGTVQVNTDAIKSYSGQFAKLTTASAEVNTDAIKSYPGAFAKLTTASIYPAADISAITSVTRSTTSIYPAADINPYTALSTTTVVVNNGVLTFPEAGYVYGGTTSSARGTSVTVVNAVTIGTPVAIRDTAVTVATGATSATTAISNVGAQIMTGLGNAVAASKATITYATGATSATSVTTNVGQQIMVGLGDPVAAAKTAVATAGTAVDVVTTVTPETATHYDAGANVSVATRGTAVTVATGATATNGTGATILISGTDKQVYTSLSTTSITPVGTTGNALVSASLGSTTGITVVTGFTTTNNSGRALVTSINANTGSAGAHSHSISATGTFTPAGTIGGSQTVNGHTHDLSNHTHSIPALSVTVPTT